MKKINRVTFHFLFHTYKLTEASASPSNLKIGIFTASNKKASASPSNLKIGLFSPQVKTMNIIEYYWKVRNHLVFFLLFPFPFLFLLFLSFPFLTLSFPFPFLLLPFPYT